MSSRGPSLKKVESPKASVSDLSPRFEKSTPQWRVDVSITNNGFAEGGPKWIILSAHEDRLEITLNPRLLRVLNIEDRNLLLALVNDVMNATSQQGLNKHAADNFLSRLVALQPRDQQELLLFTEMVAVHQAVMGWTKVAEGQDWLARQEMAANAIVKLTRAVTAQLEALQRYRNGGQQKITVERVTVHDGGQAIVGNVQAAPTISAAPQDAIAALPATDDASSAIAKPMKPR